MSTRSSERGNQDVVEEKGDSASAGHEEGPSALSVLTPAVADRIRRHLLRWYDAHRRPLPWRGEQDPYRIWVAEVMLQQTRVETAVPYYRRWLERFPTLEDLAAASDEEVLKIWEGLGYYSRPLRLLQAARVVKESYGGELPRSLEELRRLPGVGPYTAGAVGSIAFGLPVAAVDGNVRRVLTRCFHPLSPGPRQIEALARALVDPRRPGDFNQALMEVGSTLCRPRAPFCTACPLSGACGARRGGGVPQAVSPAAARRVRKVEEVVLVAVWERAGGAAFLFRRRPARGLLGGLWEFPGAELGAGADPLSAAEAVLGALGLNGSASPFPLPPLAHAFTHRKVLYHPFLWRVLPGSEEIPARWVEEGRVEEELILPAAQKRILSLAREALVRGT